MKKLFIIAALLTGLSHAMSAAENNFSAETVQSLQDSITYLFSKYESMEFTNRCDDIDSLVNYALLSYNHASELQDLAEKTRDNTEYDAYMKQLEECLEACVLPFEKSFDLLRDRGMKVAVAEYLKIICFALRDKSEFYQKRYEKYNEYYEINS